MLQGIVVLDISSLIAGPYCGSLLGDLGAEVIKIESPWAGDEIRHVGLKVDGEGALFLALNRNKKSMSLNLKGAEGREILDRLIAKADVLIENVRPGVRGEYGLQYERVREIRSDIVQLSITSFGEDGPYRDKPGADHVFQGLSGIMSISGAPGQGPLRVGFPVADMATAMFGVYGVLGALLHRQRTGDGQLVAVNLLDVAMCFQTTLMTTYLFDGKEPDQLGNDNPFAYPVGCYETADGHINISVFSDKFWNRLCIALDMEDLADDERFASGDRRLANKEALKGILKRRFRTKPTEDWLMVLEGADVPCGRVHSYDTLFSDPQVLHNNLVKTLSHLTLGEIKTLGNPVRFSSGTDTTESQAGRPLGCDTDTILKSLGYSALQIQELRNRKAV